MKRAFRKAGSVALTALILLAVLLAILLLPDKDD